jgi:DNA polymerase III subunit delta'
MAWKVVGHDRLIQGFERTVKRCRLAHAYLFSGPAGVGKRLFATELARALFCEQRGGRLEACDSCPSCVQVAAGSHPDLSITGRPEESLEIPIDTMREFCQGFGLKPARGRGRIAILDDADDLNDESANCFLKTLEEPPQGSLLLLIGTSPDRQLLTIRSRCQLVTFAPLGNESMRAVLQSHRIADADLDRLVAIGQGSPGRALALADPSLWDFRRQFLATLEKSPFTAFEQMRVWMRFIEEAGKESALQRRRAAILVNLVLDFFRQVLIAQSAGAFQSVFGPAESESIQRLAARLSAERLLDILERLLQAEQQIERRVQLVLVVEAMLDALAQQLGGAREIKK